MQSSVELDLSCCFQPFSYLRTTFSSNLIMKLATLYRFTCSNPSFRGKSRILLYRSFQHDFVPRDPNTKPKRYKYPEFYDPYGPRPPPSDKIVQLAERIISLPPEERMQIGPALRDKLTLPKLQPISLEGMDLSTQGGARAGSSKAEEKKPEKTTFDVKLEKFDAGSKLKVIKEIRSFTDLGLKEAKDLVEKAPVILKQQITKDEANSIIEKIKAVGGVAVMEKLSLLHILLAFFF